MSMTNDEQSMYSTRTNISTASIIDVDKLYRIILSANTFKQLNLKIIIINCYFKKDVNKLKNK